MTTVCVVSSWVNSTKTGSVVSVRVPDMVVIGSLVAFDKFFDRRKIFYASREVDPVGEQPTHDNSPLPRIRQIVQSVRSVRIDELD